VSERRVRFLHGPVQIVEHVLDLTLGEPAVEEDGYVNVPERWPTRLKQILINCVYAVVELNHLLH
jgi:hypothetical protein